MRIKDLRAIAHGAGYNTSGMERIDLEKIAAQHGPTNLSNGQNQSEEEEIFMKEKERERKEVAEKQRKVEEEVLRKNQETAQREKATRAAAAAAAAEAEVNKKAEEELRRKKAEFAQKWEQPTHQSQQAQQTQHSPKQGHPPFQQNTTHNSNPGQNEHKASTRPSPSSSPTHANSKYAQAVSNENHLTSKGDEQTKLAAIKRNILMNWALVPPQYNMIRPIDHLVSSLHTALPPAFDVTPHVYFEKWKPINLIGAGTGLVDEDKLKKAMKKLRFFLHPDRLPMELKSDQSLMCKMLWDVSSDGWEEHLKKKEDLDWIHR